MIRPAALLLAAGLAAPAAADTPEAAAAFLGVMRDSGCHMSLEAGDAAADALGIEIATLDDIIDLLFFGGVLDIDKDETMTLVSAHCAADPSGDAALFARLQAEIDFDTLVDWGIADPGDLSAVEPATAARFIGAVRAQDCALTAAQAQDGIAEAGISVDEMRATRAVLYETGHISHGATPDRLRLSEALCAADPDGDAAVYTAALAALTGSAVPTDPDAVIDRFGPEGVRAVLEFLADTSDCVLDTSDRGDTIDAVVAFLAFNATGIYNLPPEFSPEAEAELRALIAATLDAPGPAFAAEPGRLTLIDCTP